MPRLFVFGVGGTGSRVIESLTMLLASGMKAGDFDVVPVFVDPHKDLDELNDCKSLLKVYAAINETAYDDLDEVTKGFFRTKVTTLRSLASDTGELKDDFDFDEKYDQPFGEFLDLASLEKDNPTQQLLSLLYSKQNFEKPLSVGFKGNPNVGSVVLNAMADGPGFRAMEGAFGDNDRIFIISSIFGGTGAAGFPLLLKLFRNHANTKIKKSQIGALSVMPYYRLTDPEIEKDGKEVVVSDIDSKNFMTKTKSALPYYIRSDFSNLYNALYHIADPDKQNQPYQNNEKDQPNKAHFVELLGALSVLNFANGDHTNIGDIYEYTLKDEKVTTVTFSNMGTKTTASLGVPLTSFYIFDKLHHANLSTPKLPYNKVLGFNELYDKEQVFFEHLSEFLEKYYRKWRTELSQNERQWQPHVDNTGDEFYGLINGNSRKKRLGAGWLNPPFDLSQVLLECAKAADSAQLNKLKKVNPLGVYMMMCYHAANKVTRDNIQLSKNG